MKRPRALEIALIVIAVLMLVFFATYHLIDSPAVWYDEGFYTQVAMSLAAHGVQQLQIAPDTFVSTKFVTSGFPLMLPVSWSYRLFGVGVLQGRAVMVLYMLAFAAAAYALIRMLFGRWYAAWTLLLLASFPMFYGNGKTVIGEIPGLFFLLLFFISLLYLERRAFRPLIAYIALGLFAGLCIVTKPIFILLAPAAAIAWFVKRRDINLNWTGFILALIAFLVPVALWVHLQFGADSSLTSMLYFYTAGPYVGESHIALAIHNALSFLKESTPLYTTMLMVFWCTSVWIRKKKGRAIEVTEIVALSFSFLVLLAYLRIESFYRYFFETTMVALLFFAYGLDTTFGYIAEKIPSLRKALWLPYAFLTLLILFQLYQLSHGSYVAEYYNSTKTQDLTELMSPIGPKASVFVYDAPETVISFHPITTINTWPQRQSRLPAAKNCRCYKTAHLIMLW